MVRQVGGRPCRGVPFAGTGSSLLGATERRARRPSPQRLGRQRPGTRAHRAHPSGGRTQEADAGEPGGIGPGRERGAVLESGRLDGDQGVKRWGSPGGALVGTEACRPAGRARPSDRDPRSVGAASLLRMTANARWAAGAQSEFLGARWPRRLFRRQSERSRCGQHRVPSLVGWASS